MAVLFISDLHLCTSRPEINRIFFQFLRTEARRASDLYILGDLFEYWAGDDDIQIGLFDLMMPGMNGLELARNVRALHPQVRVVLTSAYHLSERQLARADCGVVGFVPKPFELSALFDVVARALEPP